MLKTKRKTIIYAEKESPWAELKPLAIPAMVGISFVMIAWLVGQRRVEQLREEGGMPEAENQYGEIF